jgi:hypothetical protein
VRPSGRRHCIDPDLYRLWRADERTRTADLLITSALLAIWVRPKGLLAELLTYPLMQARKPR